MKRLEEQLSSIERELCEAEALLSLGMNLVLKNRARRLTLMRKKETILSKITDRSRRKHRKSP